MAVYFKRTQTVKQDIPYEFVCEHCHQGSGILAAEFKAEATRTLMTNRPLTEDERTQLEQEATENLYNSIRSTYQNTKEESFSDKFNDKCPHCGKSQSWALRGMQHLPGSYALVGAFFTALICLGINLLGIASFSFGAGLLATLAIALIAMLVGFIQVGAKKTQTKNVQQRKLPQIHWPDSDWDHN